MFENIPVFPIEHPALRPLEFIPVMHQEQTLLMVRDPHGVIEGAAVLVPDPLLLVFLEMADGQTELSEMASKVTEASGQIIPVGMFESMAKQLDEAYMLQSERFVEALKQKYEEYMESPTRPYKVFQAPNGDRLKMMKDLGDEMRRHTMSPTSPPKNLDIPKGSVVGILSPHIDYSRGGEAYAWAYKALKEYGTGASRFIVLGTSHRPTETRFIATAKDYETPFGTVETDKELLKELEEAFGGSLSEEEYAHADEHTVELQATYLKYTYGDTPIKMVPILVGGFEELLGTEMQPRQIGEVDKFCNALKTVLDKYGDDVAIIGGVDFSHCGAEFGHEEPNGEDRVKEIEACDKKTLDFIEKGDPDAFFKQFEENMNATNMCSIAPIYVVMEALRDRGKPTTLTYQQANNTEKTNLVSFASVAFVKNGAKKEDKPRIILATR